MSFEKSCKSCKYNSLLEPSMNGWCVLRKIKIHADIAQYAFCHHWGHQEPSLPLLNNTSLTKDKQLNFDRELANIQS